MSRLEDLIKYKRQELTKLVMSGLSLNDPIVIFKSQELDKLITTFLKLTRRRK